MTYTGKAKCKTQDIKNQSYKITIQVLFGFLKERSNTDETYHAGL